MKIQILITLLFIYKIAFSQTDSISENNFVIPKNINSCISELDNVFTSKAKNKLKSLKVDTLRYLFDVFIIDEWLNKDSSRLKSYFNDLGLKYDFEMEYFILLSYYKYLLTGKGDISSELNCYNNYNDSVRLVAIRECDSLRILDSINSHYIPKDLADCYLQLDKIISDSIKSEIKTSDELFIYHFSLGMWIRNNMGLWWCSRFRDYFQKHNVMHPDNMSGIILEGYKLYLNGTIIEIDNLISKIPPPPPPVEVKIKFKAPFDKEKNRFIKKRKIDDFKISEFTMMSPNICQ